MTVQTKPMVFETTFHRHPRLRLSALGALEIRLDGEVIQRTRWESTNSRLLLVYLLLHQGYVSQQKLARTFWPGSPCSKAHRSLITTIYRIRKALGSTDLIVRKNDGYGISAEAGYDFDVERFQEHFRLGRAYLCSGDTEKSIAEFRELREIYRGDFLEEFRDQWCTFLAQSLRQRYVTALVMAAGQLLELNHRESLEWALEATRLGPDDGSAWGLLMKAYALRGERALLEKTFREAQRYAVQQLGAASNQGLRSAYQGCLRLLR